MLVSYKWLNRYVDLSNVTPKELADKMSVTGIEVEGITVPEEGLKKIVVGEVKECVPHPDSDHLSICQVDIGEDELSQIVCGAPNVAIEAGRLMLQRMDDLLSEGSDFAFETTLSTRSYVKFIERAQAKGYFVTLLYFWLPTPEQAIERVATRVREGGHNIPSDVIRRRYANGIKNLTALYIPLCNYWAIYDNSSADEQIRIIALGGKDITTHIEDTLSYKTIADYERN